MAIEEERIEMTRGSHGFADVRKGLRGPAVFRSEETGVGWWWKVVLSWPRKEERSISGVWD